MARRIEVVWHLFIASGKMFIRDRTAVFFSLFLPLVIMLIFGVLNFGAAAELDLGVVDEAETASNTAMIAFEYGSYSVPHTLAGQTVWVRPYADQVVIVHVGAAGPVEVARHARTTAGHPRVDDAHFPPRPEGPLHRTPRPKTVAEAQFLALGDGAALWLTEAGAAGCSRIRAKMAEAVDLAALHNPVNADRATGPSRDRGPIRPR